MSNRHEKLLELTAKAYKHLGKQIGEFMGHGLYSSVVTADAAQSEPTDIYYAQAFLADLMAQHMVREGRTMPEYEAYEAERRNHDHQADVGA